MSGRTGAKTILIVDDQNRLRRGLARSLGQDGFRTLTAASVEEALRLIERAKVDLVITDLVMPGTDGMALVRKVGSSALDIDVVVITAYGSAESMREARELGVAHYLAKPFDLSDLKAKVRELLARRADGGDAKGQRRAPAASRLPVGVGRQGPDPAPAKPSEGCPGGGCALRRARLGARGAIEALQAFPREALERVRPCDLLRAGGKALRTAAGIPRRVVSFISPRNVVRGLGKAARTLSGLTSAFHR